MKFIFFAEVDANKNINVFNAANKSSSIYSLLSFINLVDNNIVVVCNKNNFKYLENLKAANLADILELIVMVYGNLDIYPTISSLKNHFKLEDTENCKFLSDLLVFINNDISKLDPLNKGIVFSLSRFLLSSKWLWCDTILDIFKEDNLSLTDYQNVWKHIKKYKKDDELETSINNSNEIPVNNITNEDVKQVLQNITKKFSYSRVQQQDYANFVASAFTNYNIDKTEFIVAKAGTGVGKTLGYLANAIAFVNNNPNKQILISTYSKNLQKQIFSELKEIFKYNLSQIALVKGSNNYLCLLNYQYLLNAFNNPNYTIMLTLLARILIIVQNGDLVGGDIASIIFTIMPKELLNGVLNKKEECLFSKCSHFDNCFIMKAKYNAKNANILVSNHHFTMLKSNLGVKNIIWDEAHHLFDVADRGFATNFDVLSLGRIKYWVCGSNNFIAVKKAKLNSLFNRLQNIIAEDEDSDLNDLIKEHTMLLSKYFEELLTEDALNNILNHAPKTLVENFFYKIGQLVLSTTNKDYPDYNSLYNLEINIAEVLLTEDIANVIGKLINYFTNIQKIANTILALLNQSLQAKENKALEDFIVVFNSNICDIVNNYLIALNEISNLNINEFIYRFIIHKNEGKVVNIAYSRNYINPSKPMAINIFGVLNTCIFTSATMLNIDDNIDIFGINFLHHESYNLHSHSVESPFNYSECSKIIIINDAKKNDITYITHALNALFNSSNGGALAIFTSIQRLKAVYSKLHKISNLNIMAQHFNNNYIVNLIDEFKHDHNSCLLGTDATRDGVDIPGMSLRLVVLEKFPWNKMEIVNKIRKEHFGEAFSKYLIKLKLKQAFGRLIRTEADRGVFVLLDKAVPSDFLTVFPKEVELIRATLEQTTTKIKNFFNTK